MAIGGRINEETWNLLQENWGIEDNDAYWEKVLKDIDTFYKKMSHFRNFMIQCDWIIKH